MRGRADSWVLDTSALFCLKGAEPGADGVERILRRHGGEDRVFVSFISMMEFYYVVHREMGEAEARRACLRLKQLPIHVMESDEELGLAAARFKSLGRLSVADAWVAATAERIGAVLVHKDPEFNSLACHVRLQPLPFGPG
ncbi:MAG: type II toxin-antitoxin system VapC family toxin [Elusimicrobia bacterium]|nr:type II toxin-antitoxin system VapC family toxin [Elusimicrobiota bacterium]